MKGKLIKLNGVEGDLIKILKKGAVIKQIFCDGFPEQELIFYCYVPFDFDRYGFIGTIKECLEYED